MGQDDEDPEKRGSKSSTPYKWLSNFHHDLVAGAVMGGVVHTIVAPIEGAKLLLQTQDSNLTIVGSGRRKFKVFPSKENGNGIDLQVRPPGPGTGQPHLSLQWTIPPSFNTSAIIFFLLFDSDSNRLESDLEELSCSLDLGASQLGQGKAIEVPKADCSKDGEDRSDMIKIHEDQKFELLILNTFV
ncbi:hypothetical protein Pint_28351 [Pistacia integerrima]|uniref:Uncharacterized protein n=1 Tax=Pistacia integerrima TaxID=434235 RepID=A0ACC0YS46_9ROSI|nr:hypothetical protein Pint_28351 [Pistacia integerrima]